MKAKKLLKRAKKQLQAKKEALAIEAIVQRLERIEEAEGEAKNGLAIAKEAEDRLAGLLNQEVDAIANPFRR